MEDRDQGEGDGFGAELETLLVVCPNGTPSRSRLTISRVQNLSHPGQGCAISPFYVSRQMRPVIPLSSV